MLGLRLEASDVPLLQARVVMHPSSMAPAVKRRSKMKKQSKLLKQPKTPKTLMKDEHKKLMKTMKKQPKVLKTATVQRPKVLKTAKVQRPKVTEEFDALACKTYNYSRKRAAEEPDTIGQKAFKRAAEEPDTIGQKDHKRAAEEPDTIGQKAIKRGGWFNKCQEIIQKLMDEDIAGACLLGEQWYVRAKNRDAAPGTKRSSD